MLITVEPGGSVSGRVRVPGDKSIAHRWLMLATTARGSSELRGLPGALDVRSTSRTLAAITRGPTRVALESWASQPVPADEGDGSTTNNREPRPTSLVIEAEGRPSLERPERPLDCGNSGTTMRLLTGILAARPFASVLTGDPSVALRPMERVAAPLRLMGASIRTRDGHAPIEISGSRLQGIRYACPVPSAQVKGAILLAATDAEGSTTVLEPAATRDHTERALRHLGAPIEMRGTEVTTERYEHAGFSGSAPGDLSSAMFVVAAAVLTGGVVEVAGVGLNPTRTHALAVLERMGVRSHLEVEGEEVGEPVGTLRVEAPAELRGTTITEMELPLLVDEVPVLAMVAAHARGDTWFLGAAELRVKESDRLGGLAAAVRALGGDAAVEGDDLVLAGGGLRGGATSSRGDHRMAMAAAIGGLAARQAVTVDGFEAADVSFPGFARAMRSLGARLSVR